LSPAASVLNEKLTGAAGTEVEGVRKRLVGIGHYGVLHRCGRLKMLAVEKDTTVNALAVEALNDLLKKHGKRSIVKNPLLGD
jgi:hypothetical protein